MLDNPAIHDPVDIEGGDGDGLSRGCDTQPFAFVGAAHGDLRDHQVTFRDLSYYL